MRDLMWRMGFTLMALAILTLLGPGLSCHLDHRLVEQALGRTPQAQIDRYLAAVEKGNRQRALALWSPLGSPNVTLEARREAITDRFLTYGPHLEYRILDVAWWRTCCEPAVIEAADQAGGARIQIAVGGKDRSEQVYIFDLLVPGGYWGKAMGDPVREWSLVDIYPEGDAPLVWTWRADE